MTKARCTAAAVTSAMALAVAAPAFGFSTNSDYLGTTERAGGFSNLGFDVKHKPNGHVLVQHFTLTTLPITCSDSPDTTSTGGFELHGSMRVSHRRFAGKGDWSTIPSDPLGSVQGSFHPGNTASGLLKLRGELAGPGTHCHTGKLGWVAVKNDGPVN